MNIEPIHSVTFLFDNKSERDDWVDRYNLEKTNEDGLVYIMGTIGMCQAPEGSRSGVSIGGGCFIP